MRSRGISPWPGDQAAGLRRLFRGDAPQVVAFAGGGEVPGCTTLVVQTALGLAAAGHGVLIVDENPAPDNATAVFGLHERCDLFHVLQGQRTLQQAFLRAAPQVQVLPAARAARELGHASRTSAAARHNLTGCLGEMQQDAGFVLIDTALRRGGQPSPLAMAAQHMVVVVAAEGTAITDAYALIKRIARDGCRECFQVVVTNAKNLKAANDIFGNMRRVAHEHLGVRLDFLGATLATERSHLADALLQRLPPAEALEAPEMRGIAGYGGNSESATMLDSVV